MEGRRPLVSWALYDMANTIFSFVIFSFYFGPWLVGLGAPDSALTATKSISMVAVIIIAPILGALTDGGRRVGWLMASTLLTVVCTVFLGAGSWFGFDAGSTIALAIALFAIANVGYQVSLVLYDALLTSVATPRTQGRASAFGIGAGYVGSMLALVVGIVLMGPLGQGPPEMFVATGALFLVIALPCFIWVKQTDAVPREGPLRQQVGDSTRAILATLKGLPARPRLWRFLVARVLYADAISTFILVVGIYLTDELGFVVGSFPYGLILFIGILSSIVTAPLWGRLADRRGPKSALSWALATWILGLGIFSLIPVLGLPDQTLYLTSALTGAALTGTWASDRPLLVRLSPGDHVGEHFGLYALAGRFAALLGPLIWSFIVDVALADHAYRRPIAIVVLLGFIVAAFLMLRTVTDEPVDGRPPAEG